MADILSKHRFYYSKSQNKVIEDIRRIDEEDDGKSTYVKLSNGKLVKYTQWCSGPNSKCNWSDAVVVYETNVSEEEVLKRIVRM